MKLPPLALGAGAGLIAALLLAPATGTALGKLSAVRHERARLASVLAGPKPARAPLVAPGLTTADAAALAARIRERARAGGVLVEEAGAVAGEGALIVVRFRVSGAEKAVLALADALERDAPLVRLRGWRFSAIPGGVRLGGEAVAVRP